MIVMLLTVPAFASDPVILEKHKGEYPLGLHLEYYVDEDAKLELKDIIAPAMLNNFIKSKVSLLNFGFSRSAYWLKFTLVNPLIEEQNVLLEFAHPQMDSIDIYLVRDGKELLFKQGGDKFKYNQREIDYHTLLFKLSFPPESESEIYMRFKTEGSMQLPLTVWRPFAFIEKINKVQMFMGIYFGIMLAMFFYNLFLLVLLKDINYFYYILYIGTMIMIQFEINRYDVEYIWPNSPVFANLSFPIFYNMAFFFGALFSRNFLNTKKNTPLIDKMILLLMGVSIVGIILTLTIGYYAGFIPVLYVLAVFMPLVLLIAGVMCWKRGFTIARYYTIAWIFLLVSAVIFNLRNITMIPNVFITDYIVYFGSSLEVVFLSLALGDRINVIKKEKFLAQNELYKAQQVFTKKLESKVKDRTLELEKSNKKLERLSNTDGLTGLFNRRYFDKIIEIEWSRLQRQNRPLSIIMIDIDYFKKYNDMYGHQLGDSCIQTVAKVLDKSIHRSCDVAARYGGEEFVLVLSDVDSNGARTVAQSIIDKIKKEAIPHNASNISDVVTMSFGTATLIPDKLSKPEYLLSLSDKALYRSKEEGRNRITSLP